MRFIKLCTLKFSFADIGNTSACGNRAFHLSITVSRSALPLSKSILLITSSTGTFSFATFAMKSAFFVASSTTSVT